MFNETSKNLVIEVKINFKYSYAQAKAMDAIEANPSTYLLWKRAAGKTFIGVDSMIRRCMKYQDYTCLYAANSYANAKYGYSTAREWLAKHPAIEATVKQVVPHISITFNNDSRIVFESVKDGVGFRGMLPDMVVADDWSCFTYNQKAEIDRVAREMELPLVPLSNNTNRRLIVLESSN